MKVKKEDVYQTNDEMHMLLEKRIAMVDGALDRLVPIRENPQRSIYEAMRYSLLAGGKRIRPVLALAMGDILGADEDRILPFACALEMIHTYSLIHDDLPAMYNDDLRRGKPTCHRKFNEATAILAGDALLNKAFEVMSDYALRMNGITGLRIIAELSKLSGTEGMIGGQVTDLESEGKTVSEELLRHTYSCKTGALLKAPAHIAIEIARDRARSGQGEGETEEYTEVEKKLIRYSELIGLAFQVKDDILDIEGLTEVLGKPVGSDEKENKTTLVTLLGIERCKLMLEEMTGEAVKIAESFGEKGGFLRYLAVVLLKRNY